MSNKAKGTLDLRQREQLRLHLAQDIDAVSRETGMNEKTLMRAALGLAIQLGTAALIGKWLDSAVTLKSPSARTVLVLGWDNRGSAIFEVDEENFISLRVRSECGYDVFGVNSEIAFLDLQIALERASHEILNLTPEKFFELVRDFKSCGGES